MIAGKVSYVVGCVLAAVTLVVSGYAYHVEGQIGGIERGISLGPDEPQTGAMNILLMGLESRTDYEGNILSGGLLAAMHAGSVNGVKYQGVGGQDTNTLILIHIFAGGKKAVGISIPRDDWVTYPNAYYGQTQGKVDQAYGLAYAQSLGQTYGSSMSQNDRYLKANQAGQEATIATVQAVTGQHVDHFAEVNLAGFYELAWAFNGIEVCLKSWNGGQNLHDYNSGFNQKQTGYVHLWPAQALAFVRERDNLPHGDLDRTHRQQAVVDYVIWKLEHEGVLTDITQLDRLLSVAKQYVITDAGWQIADFATEMHALTGRNMAFVTAPVITTAGRIGNQTVNLVDIPTIQRTFRQEFTAPPAAPGSKKPATGPAKNAAPIPPPSTVTVDVYNGSGTPLLATHVSQALVSAGYKAGTTGNGSAQSHPVLAATQIIYGAGAAANAEKIAGYFGVTAAAAAPMAAGHVEVLLGTTATGVPAALESAGTTPSAQAPAPSAAATSATNDGEAGTAVTVKDNAPYGIPCVY